MSSPVKLTIICVFSEPHLIETTLSSVYELRDIPFELIIVNDGAGDDATSIIQSLSEYYDHDFTYFFEHKEQAGVGVRANEVLNEVSGNFIWVVNSIGRIKEAELVHVIQTLEKSDAVMSCLLKEIPKDLQEWISVIHNSTEEERLGFIWKWGSLPGNQKFFDPYLFDSVAFELMWRLEEAPILLQKNAWFQAAVEEQENETWAVKRELALHWLRNFQMDNTLRERVYTIMEETEAEAFEQFKSQGESLLDKARQEKSKGNIVKALHYATQAHQEEPENKVIKAYYSELLELTGRFVEANEMKIKEFEEKKPEPVKAKIEHVSEKKVEEKPTLTIESVSSKKEEIQELEAPKYSIIIPTTGYGAALLEQTFTTLVNVIDREKTELIIIDNASLDDTYDYLNDVKSQKAFRLEVITNRENKGFAASVNQGLDKATGEYILVMHNDIDFENDILYEFEQVFNDKPDAGIVVPVLSFSMINEQDKEESSVRKQDTLVTIPNFDSACFMLKKEDGFRMDEQFGLAYYDDVDLAFQVQQMEKKIYLITELIVEHHFASTTSQMGLSHQCDYAYLNMAKLYRKWGIEPQYEDRFNQLKRLDRCLLISSMMNPIDPEVHLYSLFKEFFTDEVKTEINTTKWDLDEAVSIASMLIKTDQRDILRKLEHQLDELALPITLVQDIVRYYYDRNIFSRCVHYLNRYGADPNFIDAPIFHLKILLGEKLLVEAADMVPKLFEMYPAHPELYKLTGDFHKFNGSEKESADFYDYARQIDPFRFGKSTGKVSFI
jgi:glycosyltransferase involved in cell wall biosynthesis